MTDLEPSLPDRPQSEHVLVQAPVPPVDADGVVVAQAGTALFAALSAVCWWFAGALEASGRGWWLWTCLVGAALGVLMVWFTRRRRDRSRRELTSSGELPRT